MNSRRSRLYPVCVGVFFVNCKRELLFYVVDNDVVIIIVTIVVVVVNIFKLLRCQIRLPNCFVWLVTSCLNPQGLVNNNVQNGQHGYIFVILFRHGGRVVIKVISNYIISKFTYNAVERV